MNTVEEAQVELVKMYAKDISLHLPEGLAAFHLEWKPQLQFEIQTTAKPLKELGHFEVIIHFKCTNTCSEKVAFTVDVIQAGLFKIKGLHEDALKHALATFCPNLLYPFVRETVGDLVTRAGFPQLNLAAVNFEQMYQQSLVENPTIQ